LFHVAPPPRSTSASRGSYAVHVLPTTLSFDSRLGIASYDPSLPLDVYSKLVIFKGAFKSVTLAVYGTPLAPYTTPTSIDRSPSLRSVSASEGLALPENDSATPEIFGSSSPPDQSTISSPGRLAGALRRQKFLRRRGIFEVRDCDPTLDFSLNLPNTLGFDDEHVDQRLEAIFRKGTLGRLDLHTSSPDWTLESCLSWSDEKFAKLSENGLNELSREIQRVWNKMNGWVSDGD
jgi:hypothetical protein